MPTAPNFFRSLLSFVVLLLLTGCSLTPTKPLQEVPLPAQQRQQQLQQLQNFTVIASLGVKAPADSISGSLNWQQQGDAYTASMNNFIGINIFQLSSSAAGAVVTVSGETHQAATPDILLDYLSGWSLPIRDMPLWLKGMAGQNATDLRWDPLGRLTSFNLMDSQQRQWQVSYTAFFSDRLSLPKRIILQSDDTRLTLVIRRWDA